MLIYLFHAFVNDVHRPVILQNLKRIREQGFARHTGWKQRASGSEVVRSAKF
jgi:hypothetical protein